MSITEYSTVIVTRNRPDALALSLPIHVAQDRLPKSVWVIDSSDEQNKELNRSLVSKVSATTEIPVRHFESPSGMTVQRNIGLSKVDTEVVFFPDDDSLIYPDALASMMRIYDLDTENRIGGVCSAEAKLPPPGTLEDRPANAYEMRNADKFRAKIARTRFAIEQRLFRDPFYYVADQAYEQWGYRSGDTPKAYEGENAILVPWMTGFRMSFRTECIRSIGFNEQLGRYALFEDTDASFGILKSHLLVGARNAQIYHHKAPSRRANGRALGAMQILNRAYVVARSGRVGSNTRKAHRRFSLYKIAQYATAARSSFGRERLAGARAAARVSGEIFDAKRHDLEEVYIELRHQCFGAE